MSTLARQQALLVAEAWQNLYANQSYIDFQSYTQDNLVNSILNYVQVNYPDNFNDWITNSEFVIKVRTLAWLHQNISYRIDLDIRENFVQTATRREAILMLADNVFYKSNRVTGASGELRVDSLITNQPLVDSNGDSLANIEVFWNDPANPDWFEQFMLIINAALTPRTQFGHPLTRYNNTPTRTDLYMFNSRAPSTGVYPFQTQVAGTSLSFGYYNVSMDKSTGVISELPPNPSNAMRIIYRSDGLGSGSSNTGFFLPIRQGTLSSTDINFSTPTAMQTVTLGTANVDNGGVFVQQLDTSGNVVLDWTEVDSLFGQGVAFNTLNSDINTIFETHTLINDQVEVQFGDGKFGAIPTDNFRFWYRTVNPVPLSVQPTDIARQNFIIPYVSNNVIYFLTIRASLVAPISNALPTDSNTAIQNAMGGAFAAQNRMVTAADYNLFPLSDPSILKLKTVNRTYSGHSAYSKITDPTGFYSNVKLLGEDGRLFRSDTRTSQFVSALTSQFTLDELVLQYVTPLIQESDKNSLYYTKYNEVITTDSPVWVNTSEVNGISKGNIDKFSAPVPVGPTATDELVYVVAGTFIRYNDLSGPLVVVQQVTDDGTGTDGIVLGGHLVNDTAIFSLMPPLRNTFNNVEMTAIKTQLFNLQDFGISWNQTTQSWTIVANANLNKTASFSLDFQGNTSNAQKDASWFVYLRYIPNGSDGPEWEIVNRGMGIFFESSRDVEFAYVNPNPLVDPTTGRMVRDNVNVLGVNEGRDSLHRLGLLNFGPCCPLNYDFTSDGITKCYYIRQRVTPDHVFVFLNDYIVSNGIEYTLSDTPIGEEICFLSAPTAGTTISIRVNGAYAYAEGLITIANGTGSTTFFPITGAILLDNTDTTLSLDGVEQLGDYGFYVSPAPLSPVRVLGYAVNDAHVFTITFYTGDGGTVNFATNCPSQTSNTVIVFIDGIWQTTGLDYTIDNTVPTNSVIHFATPPANGTKVAIHATLEPHLVRSAVFTGFTNGTSSSYNYPNFSGITSEQVVVGLNGVVQRYGDDYTINSSGITFTSTPTTGLRIDVYVLYTVVGFNLLEDNNSCYVTFLVNDMIFDAVDVELTPDGYVDVDGIKISPVDANLDGYPDNPYEFDDIVIADGLTDLVLWRSVVQSGFSVWDPIDETTFPKGTYGYYVRTGIQNGVPFSLITNRAGDIHFDQTSGQWLIADATSGNWILAPTQADYMSAIGRSSLKFIWTHYPADNTRIDPAISNIMDVFVLPVAYDTAYRDWISGGFITDEPAAPTAESLQNEYAYLNSYRMTDDSMIFHPIVYKSLFGTVADAELQATFLAIRALGSLLSDNDLILRIVGAIDVFFAAQNWDLGESFYMTELIAYIHRVVAPDLQSIVAVANNGSMFGDLFQIRTAPDELFISVAQPSDVKIVTGFNNDNLQITI